MVNVRTLPIGVHCGSSSAKVREGCIAKVPMPWCRLFLAGAATVAPMAFASRDGQRANCLLLCEMWCHAWVCVSKPPKSMVHVTHMYFRLYSSSVHSFHEASLFHGHVNNNLAIDSSISA